LGGGFGVGAPPVADELQQEVVRMPVETPTKKQRRLREPVPERIEAEAEGSLRALAIEQIHRVRRFKLHAVVFAVGMPLLGGLWVLTEYYEEHTWPSRFASDPDVAGTWDPWFFFVAGLWFIGLVIHALRTYVGPPVGPVGRYIRRPVTQAEVDREVARLESHR
jgi:2TM domain